MIVPYGVPLTLVGNNDVSLPYYVGNRIATVILSSSSGTTPVVAFTGNPYYYITRFYVTVDPICTAASSGMVEVRAIDSNLGVIGRTRIFLPNSVNPNQLNVLPSLVTTSDYGFFFISPSANSTVSIAMDTPLTGSGIIRVTTNYGFTSQQGS